MLARLLPGTYTFGTPAVWVGTAALLLALTLPFNTAVARRERAGWTRWWRGAAVHAVGPTHLAWHAFATPNGSSYRQTFVLCGMLVIAALALPLAGLPRLARAAGRRLALLVAGRPAIGSTSVVAESWSPCRCWRSPCAAASAALVLLRSVQARRRTARWVPVLAAALLVGAQVGRGGGHRRAYANGAARALDDYAPWGERQDEQSAGGRAGRRLARVPHRPGRGADRRQ